MTKPKKHKHIRCLVKARGVKTKEGLTVEVFELNVSDLTRAELRRWAKHFREHYMLDDHIDAMMAGGPYTTREDFLLKAVFPNKEGFGPATRSGDFTEILMADFVESMLDHWVPRTRYRLKQVPNESPKGTDIVGLKFDSGNVKKHSPNDSLLTCEVKGLMNRDPHAKRLQDAIDDAKKDSYHGAKLGDAEGAFRVGLTLNALKHRYIEASDEKSWNAVQRFQDPIARPYVHRIAAAAVFCASAYEESKIRVVTTEAFPVGTKPMLVVVKCDEMMKVIHAMYEQAANEA